MRDRSYNYIVGFIRMHTGMDYPLSRKPYVEQSLLPLANQMKFKDVDELVEHLISNGSAELRKEMIAHLTVSETSFFRDRHICDYIGQKILHPFLTKPSSEINIWSAACATGQEAYSLAMCLWEKITWLELNAGILATDVDEVAIEKARAGVYTELDVQRGLSASHLDKYFTKVKPVVRLFDPAPAGELQPTIPGSNSALPPEADPLRRTNCQSNKWQVKPNISGIIQFHTLNLTDEPCLLPLSFTIQKPDFKGFDLILLRNVLIYMNQNDRERIVRNVISYLKPGGILFLGGTEVLPAYYPEIKGVIDENVLFFKKKDAAVCEPLTAQRSP